MRDSKNGHRFYKWVGFPYEGHRLLEPAPGSETYKMHFSLLGGKRYEGPLSILELATVSPGKSMDFGRTSMGVPIVSRRGSELLRDAAAEDVQLIPSKIDGVESGFSVVNIVALLDCVDWERSKQNRIGAPDGMNLEGVTSWVIDPARANGHHLFRLANDVVTVVMSEQLKDEIIRRHLVGPGLVEMDGQELRHVMPGYESPMGRDEGA